MIQKELFFPRDKRECVCAKIMLSALTLGRRLPILALRATTNLSSRINLIRTVQSRLQKYFAFAVGQIIFRASRRPAPAERGASRSSRTLARDAMDAAMSNDERHGADGEVVRYQRRRFEVPAEFVASW
jgi:hypothetical protein